MSELDMPAEAQMAALEAELARLSDLEAIYRLRLSYYSHVNECRWDRLAELFSSDAVVDFGNGLGRHEGREAIGAALAGLDERLFVKLMSHGHVADVTGDTAAGHLFVEGRLIVDDESFITMGKVSDRYVRDGEGWLIAGTETSFYYATPLNVGWAVEGDLKPFISP